MTSVKKPKLLTIVLYAKNALIKFISKSKLITYIPPKNIKSKRIYHQ